MTRYEYLTIQEHDGNRVAVFHPDGRVVEMSEDRTLPQMLTGMGRNGWRVVHRSPQTDTRYPMTMLERRVDE